MFLCVCVRVCVHICLCVCVRACACMCVHICVFAYKHIQLPCFYCSSVFSQYSQSNPALHVSPCSGLFILKPLELDPYTYLLAVAISQWILFAFGSSLAVFWLRIIFRFGKKLTGPIVSLFSPHPPHTTCCFLDWLCVGWCLKVNKSNSSSLLCKQLDYSTILKSPWSQSRGVKTE